MWGCSHQCSWCTAHPNWPLFQPFQFPECPQPDPPECDAGSPCQTGSWTQPGQQDCSIAPRTAKWWHKLCKLDHLSRCNAGYSEMTHLSYSLAVILSFSHISWCQVITGPQDWRSHSQVYSCRQATALPLEIGSTKILLQFTGETMKSANCDKNKYSQINHDYSDQEILCLTGLAKVQVLVNVIRNGIRSRRPHLKLAISAITMKPATWK